MKPLCIDLFCGLGGWAEGFLAEGYDVVGYDIERHDYGTGGYPGELEIQDVLTIHGSMFEDAAVIVASPPCQEFSYRAMPWKRGKALVPEVLPDWWKLSESQMSADQLAQWKLWKELCPAPPPSLDLFNACFRIQREASEAAGRYIPLVVENVRGAQPWVGKAKWHGGSMYLWGDVPPAGMPVMKYRKQDSDPSWFYDNYENSARRFGSNSKQRKAWSARIAKIPLWLSSHIAKAFKPHE